MNSKDTRIVNDEWQLDKTDDFNLEGLVLADVVPPLENYWWYYPGLRRLNILLLCAIMWSTASGFDGSLFNGELHTACLTR
jgi:hypothetical protein